MNRLRLLPACKGLGAPVHLYQLSQPHPFFTYAFDVVTHRHAPPLCSAFVDFQGGISAADLFIVAHGCTDLLIKGRLIVFYTNNIVTFRGDEDGGCFFWQCRASIVKRTPCKSRALSSSCTIVISLSLLCFIC